MSPPSPLPGDHHAYSPFVSSPLNPDRACNLQTKGRPRCGKKVRILGKTGGSAARQSLTDYLLRHKAATAFYRQVGTAALAKRNGKGDRNRPDMDGGDSDTKTNNNNSNICACGCGSGDDDNDNGRDEGRLGLSSLSRLWPTDIRTRATSDSFLLSSLDLVVIARPTGANSEPGRSPLEVDEDYCIGDEKKILAENDSSSRDGSSGSGGGELLADFTGVTIETLTAIVLTPRQRRHAAAMAALERFAGWPPGRILWVLGMLLVVAVLVFVRLQALFLRYFKP